MEIVTILLLIVIITLVIILKSNVSEKFENFEDNIAEIRQLLVKIEKQSKNAITEEKPSIVQPVKPIITPLPPKMEEAKPEPIVERQQEVITDIPSEIRNKEEVFADGLSQIRKPIKEWTPPPVYEEEEPRPTFFERNPDLEKFIGENLFNKIVIAILVLAIGFFVKYAIDNNWIGPIGRVGIGFICGGILIGFAHKLRITYKTFSSVLTGGGLAIFYFTITLAFQEFHLFSQLIALSLLIVITIFSVLLSLLYDKQELAIIALIGGFSSPFLVSNGSANYNGLFIYLLILNIGLLTIAYFKAWRILNILAYAFSIIVLATVVLTMPDKAYLGAFIFLSVFYLLFFAINIINNVRENKKFLAIDFTILLSNTTLYFSAGLFLFSAMELNKYLGFFSAGLATINLVLSYILFKTRKVDTNILYLLIGITFTFISLTAPLQLHGHYITLFWASECVLLYWLSQKSAILLLRIAAYLIWIAMMVSLVMDLNSVYFDNNLAITIIFNKGFITTIYSAVCTYILYVLINKEEMPEEPTEFDMYKGIFKYIAFILMFLGGLIELNYQFLFSFPKSSLNVLYTMLYIPVFVLLFNFIYQKIENQKNGWQLQLILLFTSLVVYLFSAPVIILLLNEILLKGNIPFIHTYAHWASDMVMILIFYQLVRLSRKYIAEENINLISWGISALAVIFLSAEFSLLSTQLFYAKDTPISVIGNVYVKAVLPVLWGVLSFIIMWVGLRKKIRVFRIISLTLFFITLAKLFISDIIDIPITGKIAAFFCLGVLLLIISFMYQKVKKIIVDDKPESND